MTAGAIIAVALAAGSDPCAPVAPEGALDPAAAAEYRAVGDAERDAGSRETAAAAYRAALARDPSNAAARAALAALCEEERRDGAFRRGLRLMTQGDRSGAIAAFEQTQAGAPDLSSALLEGICLYEEGEDGRARALLEKAEQDPEHREAARFFLGLVAMREGRNDRAVELLQASAVDRRLAPLATDLSRLARREGRLVLSILLETGYDSNVDLTPDATRGVLGAGDGSAGATALARYEPFGDTGPFLRAAAHWRDELTYDAFDIRGLTGAAGWQGGRGGKFWLAEYAYDYRDLGGKPFLSASRLLGSTRAAVGPSATAGVTYFARWERFIPSVDADYSGLRHFAEADFSWPLADGRSTATVAWHGGLDSTRDRSLSWRETGPRVSLRLALSRDVRLGVDSAFTWRDYRDYGGYDPLHAERSDRYLDLAGILERELGDRWTLRLSLAARKAFSNDAFFEYTKIVPMLGIVYTAGVW